MYIDEYCEYSFCYLFIWCFSSKYIIKTLELLNFRSSRYCSCKLIWTSKDVDLDLHVLRACRSLKIQFFTASILPSTKDPLKWVTKCLFIENFHKLYVDLDLGSFTYWVWARLLIGLGLICLLAWAWIWVVCLLGLGSYAC